MIVTLTRLKCSLRVWQIALIVVAWIASDAAANAAPSRRVLTDNELKQEPYRYVGRVTCVKVKDKHWGTGTYIGSGCVLTAAHVVKGVWDAEEEGHGRKMFIFPDGRSSEIVAATLDAGWARGYVTFDIGLCRLRDDFGAGAPWGKFSEATFGSKIGLVGYDNNFAAKHRKPVMIVREGTARAVKLTDTVLKDRFLEDVRGLASFGAPTYLLSNHVYNQWGWCTDDMRTERGCSGGPIWRIGTTGSVIIGVQSSRTNSTGNPGNIGPRIYEGTDEMIRRFLEGKAPPE